MNCPLVSLIFLKRSLVFPILFFSSLSLHWSLRKAFLSLLAILRNSTFKWVSFLFFFAFSFFSQLFESPPQTAILLFCISFQVAHSKWTVSSDCCCNWDFPDSSVVKNLPAMQETQEMWVRSLGQEDPPEEEMTTHFSILAWKIPRTEESGRLQSMGLQKHWVRLNTHTTVNYHHSNK